MPVLSSSLLPSLHCVFRTHEETPWHGSRTGLLRRHDRPSGTRRALPHEGLDRPVRRLRTRACRLALSDRSCLLLLLFPLAGSLRHWLDSCSRTSSIVLVTGWSFLLDATPAAQVSRMSGPCRFLCSPGEWRYRQTHLLRGGGYARTVSELSQGYPRNGSTVPKSSQLLAGPLRRASVGVVGYALARLLVAPLENAVGWIWDEFRPDHRSQARMTGLAGQGRPRSRRERPTICHLCQSDTSPGMSARLTSPRQRARLLPGRLWTRSAPAPRSPPRSAAAGSRGCCPNLAPAPPVRRAPTRWWLAERGSDHWLAGTLCCARAAARLTRRPRLRPGHCLRPRPPRGPWDRFGTNLGADHMVLLFCIRSPDSLTVLVANRATRVPIAAMLRQNALLPPHDPVAPEHVQVVTLSFLLAGGAGDDPLPLPDPPLRRSRAAGFRTARHRRRSRSAHHSRYAPVGRAASAGRCGTAISPSGPLGRRPGVRSGMLGTRSNWV